MSKNTDFANLRQLLDRVDSKFHDVVNKYPASFQCKQSCFGCCRSGLTVTNVEARHIKDWVERHPEVKLSITAQLTSQDKVETEGIGRDGSEVCSFLDANGGCQIYEVRPVVCRSHGAPILMPSEEDPSLMDADVCPLNFQDFDLEKLPAEDWLRVDTLNMILAAVDKDFSEEGVGKRVELSPRGILGLD
jgi:Fe-S-cluster containining protein